jgi:hypothetical protein
MRAGGKQFLQVGKTCIHRIAAQVEDPCVRKGAQDQARQHEVAGVLVAEESRSRRTPRDVVEVATPQFAEIDRADARDALGIEVAQRMMVGGPLELHAKIVELAA